MSVQPIEKLMSVDQYTPNNKSSISNDEENLPDEYKYEEPKKTKGILNMLTLTVII